MAKPATGDPPVHGTHSVVGQIDNAIGLYLITLLEMATATTMAPPDYANWLNGNTLVL